MKKMLSRTRWLLLAILMAFLAGSASLMLLYQNGEGPEIEVLRGLNQVSSGGEGYNFEGTPVEYLSPWITFIIYNNGSADLVVEDVSLRDGDTDHFVLKPPKTPVNIPAGDYVSFTVAFHPGSMGLKWAAVEILSNDLDEGIYSFNVTGNAIAAPPPSNVRALAENEKVTLTWESVASASAYNVYWSTSPGVSKLTGNAIRNVTCPYVHMNLTNGVTYFYVVTAESAYGEGVESIEVSAEPGKTYYVDDRDGDDSNDGVTPEAAWKTLNKVNSMSFQPG